MFDLIRKSSINKLLTEYCLLGLKTGLKIGTKIGRMQAGDKNIIVSARVQQEIEKILEDKEV